jgi:hypothetical protein
MQLPETTLVLLDSIRFRRPKVDPEIVKELDCREKESENSDREPKSIEPPILRYSTCNGGQGYYGNKCADVKLNRRMLQLRETMSSIQLLLVFWVVTL